MIRAVALATLLLCGSAPYAAAASDRTSDPKSAKVAKEKDDKVKTKDVVPVSVPDGDPSTAILLVIGVAGFAVFGWRQRSAHGS